MLNSKIKVTIPKPCQQNWLEMTDAEQGRFCQLCQKNVFDFTQSSDREINIALEKDQFLCGRFSNSQLDRDLLIPKEKSSVWLATSSAIISFLGFGMQETVAQEKILSIEQTDKKVLNNKTETILDELVETSGLIIDAENRPLENISIVINTKFIAISDANGKFSIKTKNYEEIFFYDKKEIYDENLYVVDGPKQNIIIILDKLKPKKECIVGGAMMIKKRTFLGRLFYAIGNWFK